MRSRLTLALAMYLAFSGSAAAAPQLIDSFVVPSNSPAGTMGTVSLNAGLPYDIVVMGTYSFFPSTTWTMGTPCGAAEPAPLFPTANDTGVVGSDPVWNFAAPQDSFLCVPTVLVPQRQTNVQFDLGDGTGYQIIDPVDDALKPSHSYVFRVMGSGAPLRSVVTDAIYGDNYGAMSVEVHTVQPEGDQWALSFDGINDFARVAGVPAQYDYTYEVWAKLGIDDPASNWVFIMSQNTGSGCSHGTALRKFPTRTLVGSEPDSAPCGGHPIATAETGDCWVHIAATYSGTTARIYVNGTLRDSVETVLGSIHSGLSLGSNLDPSFFGDVEIAEARFWAHERTQEEILADLAPGSVFGARPGLVALYLVEEGQGQTLFDSSGNGHHMQLGNSSGPDPSDPSWILTDPDGDGVPGMCSCSDTDLCEASPNSTGNPARISYMGSTSVSANDLVLTATGCPSDTNGLFIYSPDHEEAPLGDGVLCLGNSSLGFVLRLDPLTTDSNGTVTYALDLTAPPHPEGAISAGERWYFQFWFRDPEAMASGFNFSDGASVSFCP